MSRGVRIFALLVALGLGCAPGIAQAAGRQIAASAHVRAQIAPAGVSVIPATPIPPAIPLRVRNTAAYVRAKRAAGAATALRPLSSPSSASPASSALSASSPSTAVFGGLNASGLSASQEISQFGLDTTPPDTTGAIGPSQYIEIVDSEITMYDSSDLAMIGSPVALDKFTGGTSTCDPQIKHDPQSGRWFYVALRCDGTTTTNQLYVGWSKATNPSDLSPSSWCTFAVASSPATSFDDYPKLGLDASHVIIGSNLYDASSGSFQTAHILVAAKPAAGTISSCAAPMFTLFGSPGAGQLKTTAGNTAFTPEPATVSDGSSATGYVVAADFNDSTGDTSGSNLMLWHIGESGGSPALTPDGDVPVPSFSVPPNVPQPGTTDTLDSLDGRLTQAVAAADPNAGNAEAIWTQHTIADSSGPGSVVRWYEVVASTMTVRQSGDITDSAGYAFNGAIAPTLNGGAVIDYDTGGPTQMVEIKAQSRTPPDALSIMYDPTTLASSSAIDSDFSCPSNNVGSTPPVLSCRWGDYAGASIDPNNPDVVWGSNQVNGTAGASTQAQWATQNFALALGPAAAFTAAPDPAPAGSSVSFDASASSDASGTITSYSWNFGDGSTAASAAATISHVYAAPGSYPVTLTVTDDRSQTGNVSHTVTVAAPPSVSISSPIATTLYAQGKTVPASYGCSEGAYGPGLASCTGTVPNGAPIDTSTVGAHVITVTATSSDGQTATASAGYTVAGAPSVYVSSPASNGIYIKGQVVRAGYSCSEGPYGPGLSSCTGTVSSGAPITTSTLGAHVMTVSATSSDGQTEKASITYKVGAPLQIAVRSVRALVIGGRAKVKLACLAGRPGNVCHGMLALAQLIKVRVRRRIHGRLRTVTVIRAIVFARTRYAVRTGAHRLIMLRLSPRALTALAHAPRHQLRLRARATLRGGRTASRIITVQLKPPPKRR